MGYSPWGRKELDTTEVTEYTCSTIGGKSHSAPALWGFLGRSSGL